jgi:hypothetical protein
MGAPEDGAPDGETCREARRQIASFVHASPDVETSRFLHAHVERCPACHAAYREALTGAARVGRAVRAERVERERDRRHRELVRLSRGAAGMGGSRRGPRPWLKLFLATCALFFLFTRLPALGFGSALYVEQASGAVVAADVRIGPDQRLSLARGQRCLTGPDASAVLHGDAGELRLGPATTVLIEEPDGRDGVRVRLLGGALELSGRCVVTTMFGVATLDGGRARVELDGLLRASCAEGELAIVGPLGERRLRAGTSADIGL